MSKRALKKYLSELDKEQLEDQIIELYDKFKEVKAYYNFAFNPKEDFLLEEARFRISKEYFPISSRKPKKRRSVAQKLIKQFMTLGVSPQIIVDVMLYNIEIAQTYNRDHPINQETFYRSMYNSFEEALGYISQNGVEEEFFPRLEAILSEAENQNWVNVYAFEKLMLSHFAKD